MVSFLNILFIIISFVFIFFLKSIHVLLPLTMILYTENHHFPLVKFNFRFEISKSFIKCRVRSIPPRILHQFHSLSLSHTVCASLICLLLIIHSIQPFDENEKIFLSQLKILIHQISYTHIFFFHLRCITLDAPCKA